MALILGNLVAANAATRITYGTGEFIYLAPDDTTGLTPDYALLSCWTMEAEGALNPDTPCRIICGGICQRCTVSSCSGGPPPPYGIVAQNSRMAVRNTLGFAGTRITLSGVTAIGPVYSGSYSNAIPTMDDIQADLTEWMGARELPIVMHVYRLEDPNATLTTWHPLHKHIIAIPVAFQTL